ncbi:DNA repair exonuclease [Dasineura jujubifolia toursvirus 2a]|nr:DNA repair exonuclease [Dasineura jujubifolia toursvirus 2a]
MVYKVLFISDLHFKINNNEYINAFIEETLSVIKNNKFSLCVMAGDLLDTHEKIHQTPYNKVISFIDDVRSHLPVVILVGNHDYENNQQFLTDKHWLNPLKMWKNVKIVDKVFCDLENYITYVPYVPPGRFIEALNNETKTTECWKKSKIIFAHQEFKGCDLGIQKSEHGDKWDLSYPLVVSGHIHKAHSPQKNIIYPGSIIQHNFGEESNTETGLYIICFGIKNKDEDENILTNMTSDMEILKSYRIHIDIPSMRSIDSNYNDFKQVLKKLQNLRPLERVRINVYGSSEDFKAIRKTKEYLSLPFGIKVSFRLKQDNICKENIPKEQLTYITFEKTLLKMLEEKKLTNFFHEKILSCKV